MPEFGGKKFDTTDHRRLDMSVRVHKADGRMIAVVAEADLERHGWGTDPLEAIERYRAERNTDIEQDVALGKPRRESWDHTVIEVHSDEESGYPTRQFMLRAQWGVKSTRSEAALRILGQYLIDVANGVADSNPSEFVGSFQLEESHEEDI